MTLLSSWRVNPHHSPHIDWKHNYLFKTTPSPSVKKHLGISHIKSMIPSGQCKPSLRLQSSLLTVLSQFLIPALPLKTPGIHIALQFLGAWTTPSPNVRILPPKFHFLHYVFLCTSLSPKPAPDCLRLWWRTKSSSFPTLKDPLVVLRAFTLCC